MLVVNGALPATGVETASISLLRSRAPPTYASAGSGSIHHFGAQVQIMSGSMPLARPQMRSSRVLTIDGFARLIALEIEKRARIAREAVVRAQ